MKTNPSHPIPADRHAMSLHIRRGLVVAGFVLWMGLTGHAQTAEVDQPMNERPKLAKPDTITVWPDGMVALWIKALERPEIEIRVEACAAIGEAHREGMPGLDAAVPALLRLLNDLDQAQSVRDAAAESLVTLNAQAALPDLEQANRRNDQSMILITDSMLATHRHAAMTPLWLDRVSDDDASDPIRSSSAASLPDNLQASEIQSLLQAMTTETTSWLLRQAIAHTLGRQQRRPEIVSVFRTLTPRRPGVFWRLIQADMLNAGFEDEQALLMQLIHEAGTEAQPSAWLALKKLNAIEPWVITPELARQAIANTDTALREQVIRALNHRGDAQAVSLLGLMLNDADPANRRAARDTMLRLANRHESLKRATAQAATLALADEDWRAQEQAALLLGSLHDQSAQQRMIELLDAPRQEARVAAIIGLRRLTEARLPADTDKPTTPADDPAMRALLGTVQPMLTRLIQPKKEFKQTDEDSQMVSQIFQSFGVVRYQNPLAMTLMLTLVPKNSGYRENPRAAAVWAIGRLEQDTANASLVNTLDGRLSDVSPIEPETQGVRRAAAIAIGLIKPAAAPKGIKRYSDIDEAGAEIAGACRWALQRITGQPQPPFEPFISTSRQWFLVPTRK